MNDSKVNPQTFLFVHGLWHGSWVWDEVVLRVQKAGHHAVVMDLPGRAGDSTPPGDITLTTHANAIASVARVAAQGDRKVTLVGHSTTGVYITQAAELCSDILTKLVYVSAFVPLNGQSSAELQGMGAKYGGELGPFLIREPPYIYFKAEAPL